MFFFYICIIVFVHYSFSSFQQVGSPWTREKKRFIIVLTMYWWLHLVMQHVSNMQELALNEEWETIMILNICFDAMS
jgi:hypothetical protein